MLFFNIIKAVPFLVHMLFYNHKKMGVPSKMLSVFIERKDCFSMDSSSILIQQFSKQKYTQLNGTT